MPIVQVPYGEALPTTQQDYVRQNNLIYNEYLNTNRAHWDDGAGNIRQGAVFQVGGTVYYANAATAIGGVASDYIKLTPAGVSPNMTLTPSYVANLTGVTWNSAYNGYYDVGGNAYIFDELTAIIDGEIAGANTKLGQAIQTLLSSNATYTGSPDFTAPFQNGRWPTDSLEMSNPTFNNIFDALDPYIPNNNDEILIIGGAGRFELDVGGIDYHRVYIFNRAVRIDSTNIYLYYLLARLSKTTGGGSYNASLFDNNHLTITDGSATAIIDDISISW